MNFLISEDVEGILTSRDGSSIRLDISFACVEVALALGLLVPEPRARFIGRCERGSAEVGIDSGMGSDILEGL